MATVERQEDGPEGRGDLRDRIHGVGLEVERVRTEMAEMETKLMEKMGDLEAKLSDRIDGVEKTLRGWLVYGVSLIGVMIALVEVLG